MTSTPSVTPRMHIRQTGIPGQPAVVFLHGVGNSGGMWAQHMQHLSGYHCLAPDLPGFGRSNRLSWVSISDTARQVAQLIESQVPRQRAHVVGLSLGGAVAHTLLAQRSDLLDSMIIDGCSVLPWWGLRFIKAGVAALSPFLGTRPVIEAVARTWGLDEESKADLKAASPSAFRRGFADANSLQVTSDELASTCPTLLVAGERELRPPVRASNAALAALMPEASARYVPGEGHGWLGRAPQLHEAMVNAWLNGLPLPDELKVECVSWDERRLPTHLR